MSISITLNRGTVLVLALAGSAYYLYNFKPKPDSFKAFFLKWAEKEMAQGNTKDIFGSMDRLFNKVSLHAQYALAVTSFEDYYIFTECSCTLPGLPPLQFLGVAGEWYYVGHPQQR
eukprot:gb/GEZN01025685.1/.p1 GENE.gb/GEZN01025685.1/~~gb/GEZN01025685.1/.p1  ORF type:complete len:116 (-),score=8.10 gb/GEZN01025685.1/:89-436(-)